MTQSFTISFPTGPITITSDSHYILSISHTPGRPRTHSPPPNLIKDCVHQLEEYFRNRRKTFDLNLKFMGTPFRKKVWKALQEIPYGEVISYSGLASIIKSPKACRAVGAANNANPFSIVVPCHRVIGIKNDLVGYRGGLEKKSLLLRHEGFCIKNLKIWTP